MDIATAIRMEMAKRNMTAKQISEATGLSKWQVSRTINGRREATILEIDAISGALGVTPWDLVRSAREVGAA